MKKSKLLEKPARMPDIREPYIERSIRDYLEKVQELSSEPARSECFSILLDRLFGDLQLDFIENYLKGKERYVQTREKDRILRGEIDNLFGNLVIEFERDLGRPSALAEAEGQLRKYIACLWSEEEPQRRTPYLCLAADGLMFKVYSPQAPLRRPIEPEEVSLNEIESLNWRQIPPMDIYFWLDRHFRRRETLRPSTEQIVKDFGPRSHAFQVTGHMLLAAWEGVKDASEFDVVYQSWAKYLRITYGGPVADEELFIRHTYLATFAKLISWMRLAEPKSPPDDETLVRVLEGQFFKEQGVENFLEEDFFSWIAREGVREVGIEASRRLYNLLAKYWLRELSEDVLKSLYQELVDPKARHDLGEYYTPDWLAHRMVQTLLERNPRGSVLDPACGSGTFLYLVIREKRERLRDLARTLRHILDSVAGVDIHPLAVIVAKTNYILALGDLLKKRPGKIAIPVYLADAIHLPERELQLSYERLPGYKVQLDDQIVHLPEKLVEEPALYDEAIEAAKDFAVQMGEATEEQFINYLQAHFPRLAEGANGRSPIASAIFHISQALRSLIRAKRDTIWAFVLKNIYKPLFLRRKFDFVVGNPPWLSYRYVERGEYQKFLKKQITEEYNLLSGKAELITQMELGTLFFLRAADLYLKPGGAIAFVLPRSIFTADQHSDFRSLGDFGSLRLRVEEVWDLEGVEPLFNVPACVVLARKGERPEVPYPLPCRTFHGTLPRRNADLDEAAKALEVAEESLFLNRRGERTFWATKEEQVLPEASPYRELFRNGATIYPRPFWFVEVKASPLGFNPSLPPLETAERAKRQAKLAYKGLVMKGNVEARFLYATLLSTDLLPFGHLPFRLVVLPIEPKEMGYTLLTAEEAWKKGYLHLARWLEAAQGEWERRRGEKAERMNVLEWLDYRHKLTAQNPQARYRVLYPTSATYMCACVVENRSIEFEIGGQSLEARGIIVSEVTYHFETDNEAEAHYLAAVLNAPVIDQKLKPMQARGQWGPRHIHKKVLELPIPQFDPQDAVHRRLAELGKECSEKVAAWLEAGGPGKIRNIGRLRSMVREMLAGELGEIDGLVREMIEE
jgi:SAM-dependent methyltransferase